MTKKSDYFSITFYCKITDRATLREHLLALGEERGIPREDWADTGGDTEEDMISSLADLDLGPTEALWRIGLHIFDQSISRSRDKFHV